MNLEQWQARLARALTAYTPVLQEMAARDALYRGVRNIARHTNTTASESTRVKRAGVVRNIVSELIEAQVSADIPQPKVTARNRKDEEKAVLIEQFLRAELDRLPFEALNDMDERVTPVHGGDLFLVEWDNQAHTHQTTGELSVTLLHPRQFIPQPGVCEIEDMDWFFLQVAQTKAYIKRHYDVDVAQAREQRPESRSFTPMQADDMVTQNIAYYRNAQGGIGRFSWVEDVVLEDLQDYQARYVRRCVKCDQPMQARCAYCGSTRYTQVCEHSQTLLQDERRTDGSVIAAFSRPAVMQPLDAHGLPQQTQVDALEPTRIAYYKPAQYPVILRRNVTTFGRFLGESDVDKMRDQQEGIKKIASKIEEKILKGGSFITLPKGKTVRKTDEELKVIEIVNPAEKALIDVLNIQPDISKDMAYEESLYQQARQMIGVTDSFQGRNDSTATSGKAKQFSAAQAAGRFESKKVMKNAAYAALFERMFQFALAFMEEPRPVALRDRQGGMEYAVFSRWDFLEQDEAGQWYWNDAFLFSVDAAAPLASNREAMWQETRMNLKDGCFGNPQNMQTLLRFWSKMELLHYPGAKDTKSQLEQEYRQQQTQVDAQKGEMSLALSQLPDGYGSQADGSGFTNDIADLSQSTMQHV